MCLAEEDESQSEEAKARIDCIVRSMVIEEVADKRSSYDDDDGKDDKEEINKVYSLIADVAPEEIFGLEIDAWVNDDDEVFFVNVKTAEKDILLDTVNGDDSDDKEITLKNAFAIWKGHFMRSNGQFLLFIGVFCLLTYNLYVSVQLTGMLWSIIDFILISAILFI